MTSDPAASYRRFTPRQRAQAAARYDHLAQAATRQAQREKRESNVTPLDAARLERMLLTCSDLSAALRARQAPTGYRLTDLREALGQTAFEARKLIDLLGE